MAKFIDQREDEDLNGEDVVSFDEPEDQPEQAQEEQSIPEEDIPEKYQGKDLKDIVRMHQEAEKLLGRQSSEVGELRKIVDDFVQTQLTKEQQAHASTATEEIDFFEDPQRAVEAAIANHPKIKEAETVSQQLRRSEAIARLKAEHPDFNKIVSKREVC